MGSSLFLLLDMGDVVEGRGEDSIVVGYIDVLLFLC